MEKAPDEGNDKRMKKGLIITAIVLGLGVLLAVLVMRPDEEIATVFVVRQGDLAISVTDGGSIEALESQEIRSEVKGHQGTKILSIVEEGYLVTDEDVKNGKVLVELDSSEIKQRITTQDIQFQSTIASLTEAQQAYDIQFNQNKTDIKSAEQKVRFARMDLEKFLGSQVTEEVLKELEIDSPADDKGMEDQISEAAAAPAAIQIAQVGSIQTATDVFFPVTRGTNSAAPITALTNEMAGPSKTVDFSKYARLEVLEDGEAKQKLRKLEDDLLVAKSEYGVSKTQFEGSQRLSERGFVTRNTLQNEEIAMQKNDLKVQTAETARALFIKYEFTKTAEELLSKFEEAQAMYERTKKEAVSKLAQAQAKFKSAEGRYRIETEQRNELQDQLEKCTVRAMKSGLVVYGGGNADMVYYGQEQIREGATVRERQPIITIPEMRKMSAKVKIHESHIQKIKKGMQAVVRVDSFANETLEGEVIKVGVLPDSQNRWMNPDLKVYLTSVKLEGVREWLKPGMSAKVEILVNKLTNVVYVPIQAVSAEEDLQVCYVVNGGKPEKRVVETGEFNDEFIEIKLGLKAGEKVLLRPPNAGTKPQPSSEKEAPAEESTPNADSPSA